MNNSMAPPSDAAARLTGRRGAARHRNVHACVLHVQQRQFHLSPSNVILSSSPFLLSSSSSLSRCSAVCGVPAQERPERMLVPAPVPSTVLSSMAENHVLQHAAP